MNRLNVVLKFFGCLIILFLICINLIRFFDFAFKIAGVEHDSGWYLGVAKNLAEKGEYASSTNTVLDNQLVTVDIFDRQVTVGKDDLIYFPSGVTVGPAFIFPVALILRIFGPGFYQFRLFPVITYILLLITIIWLVRKKTGLLSAVLIMVFFNLFPQLMIPLAFEAYAEPTGFFYLLLGVVFLALFFQKQKKKKWVFLSGLFFSLAVLTKTLYFINLLPFLLIIILGNKNNRRWRLVLLFSFSFLLPIGLFEFYRLAVLWKLGGLSAWLANTGGYLKVMVTGGSGLGSQNQISFFWQKLAVFKEIGIQEIAFFPLCLTAVLWLVVKKIKEKDLLVNFLFILFLTNSFWFLNFSPTGWPRHFWPGLVLGLMMLSMAISFLFNQAIRRRNWLAGGLGLLVVVFCFKKADINNLWRFNQNQELLRRWKSQYAIFGPKKLPLPIFPLAKEKPVGEFINKEIPKEAKIYYVGGFLVTEIPPFTDRIFYPVGRAYSTQSIGVPIRGSYVIFGPFQVSRDWQIISFEEYTRQIKRYCGQEIFSNDYYKICLLKQ